VSGAAFPPPVSPTPPRAHSPAPPGVLRQTVQMQAIVEPAIWYRSGWMLGLVAGLITVLASVIVFLALKEPATASIEIRTSPNVQAKVFLDGIERGHTPMRMDGVPVGERLLEIRAPGYQPVMQKITLTKGATAFLEKTLKTAVGQPVVGVPQAPVPGTPAPGTAPGATSAPPRPATPSADTTNTGTLVIDSEPWSRVFIDGKDSGLITPIRSLRIEAGAHKIGMKTPDGKMHEETVNVIVGQSLKIIREFEYGQR